MISQKNQAVAVLFNRGFAWSGDKLEKVRRTGAVTTVEFVSSETSLTLIRTVRSTSGQPVFFNTVTVFAHEEDTLWNKASALFPAS